jgi:effector-binding domain-containing protein
MKTLVALALASSFAVALRAADPSPFTDVRVKETAPRSYLCMKKDVKLPALAEFAPDAVTQLMEKATELKLGQGGPIMLTYYNFSGDPAQTFTAEVGLPIWKKDVAKSADVYVRNVPKTKCASAIYQGPLTKIGDAWHSFATTAMSKGEVTGESHELYLYWEGNDSPNKIIELQMVLK